MHIIITVCTTIIMSLTNIQTTCEVKDQPVYHLYVPMIISDEAPVFVSKPFNPTPDACNADVYNCSDFATHDEAQQFYQMCWDKTGADYNRLDADKDGIACEALH